jgi:hypothetical protein
MRGQRLRKQRTLPSSPVDYPAGTFVHTEKGYFYIVAPGKRYRLVSPRVVASWAPHRILETTEAAVQKYRISAKMKFRNGSLIWNISDGKLYLIENGLRRWVQNPDWYYKLGLDPADLRFNMKHVQIVSLDEINLHDEGEPLS